MTQRQLNSRIVAITGSHEDNIYTVACGIASPDWSSALQAVLAAVFEAVITWQEIRGLKFEI